MKDPETYEELGKVLRSVVDDEKKGPLAGGIEYGSGSKKRLEIIHRFNIRERIAGVFKEEE